MWWRQGPGDVGIADVKVQKQRQKCISTALPGEISHLASLCPQLHFNLYDVWKELTFAAAGGKP